MRLDLVWCGDPGEDQDPVTERGRLSRGEPEVALALPVAEDFFAERISGEEAVAARVPVGGEPHVHRVIQDRQRDRLPLHDAREHRPAAGRAPEDRKSTRLNSSHPSISYAV